MTQSGKVRVSTLMRELNVDAAQILAWAGQSEGGEGSLVERKVVTAGRESEQTDARRTGDVASRSSNGRVARAGRTRQQRSSKRVKLDFSLSLQDKQALIEIQEWVDHQRGLRTWEPEAGWRPSRTHDGDEPGTISYETPVGWVENVPASDFRRMAEGKLNWIIPVPDPHIGELRRQARRLADLSFQARECRMCHQPIDEGEGPEMAQIRQLLQGRWVLPYISHSLKDGQQELRFRRLHLLHAVWEEAYARILVKSTIESYSDRDLAKMLTEAGPVVLGVAQRRRPHTTETEIYMALDEVLAAWEREEIE